MRHSPFPFLRCLAPYMAAVLLTQFPSALTAEYRLVWSDEFNQTDGTKPDPANWGYDIGTGVNGWGNAELQYYTDRTDNAYIENGNLVIEVRAEEFGGRDYTSARLLSQDKHEFAYGKIEARIKVPQGGAGLWPAFWSLGYDFPEVGWAQCGEIDIMEYVSREPREIFGTIHGPLYSGGASISGEFIFPQDVADNFHVFSIEWEPNHIRWFVDGVEYHSVNPESLGSTRLGPKEWVFNKPFFLILNVAVGGTFGGEVDPNLGLPTQMLVDYVRVYSKYGMFGGFPALETRVDSGDFLGGVDITHYPWVYIESMQAYGFAADSDSQQGWIYFPK